MGRKAEQQGTGLSAKTGRGVKFFHPYPELSSAKIHFKSGQKKDELSILITAQRTTGA